jgi:hypothetical protein
VRPYLEKIPSQKRAGEATQDIGPEFKSQNCKKKKEKRVYLAHSSKNWEVLEHGAGL